MYFSLLKKQLFWLNRNNERLFGRSKTLYTKYLNNTLAKNISDRCCNFKLLEKKCEIYNKNKSQFKI